MSPILKPGRGVQEILDYGLYGFAMSRYTGTWDRIQMRQGQHRIDRLGGWFEIDRVKIEYPDDFAIAPAGRAQHPGWGDSILEQEARLQDYKRDAMLAFIRANNLNRTILSGGRHPKVGVITVGKSYLDVRQATGAELGLDEVNGQ